MLFVGSEHTGAIKYEIGYFAVTTTSPKYEFYDTLDPNILPSRDGVAPCASFAFDAKSEILAIAVSLFFTIHAINNIFSCRRGKVLINPMITFLLCMMLK